MSDREASELGYEALTLVLDDQPAEAVELVTRLLQDGDGHRVYGLCCGFAEGARKALLKLLGGRAPIFANGEQWGIKQLAPGEHDAAALFSLQFTVAYANGDRDTTRALFNALFQTGEEARVDGVVRLFRDVADLCRRATEPSEGEGG